MRKSDRRTHTQAIAYLKGFGENARLRARNLRDAYGGIDYSYGLYDDVLKPHGLMIKVEGVRDHYVLTGKAWSRDDFTSEIGE